MFSSNISDDWKRCRWHTHSAQKHKDNNNTTNYTWIQCKYITPHIAMHNKKDFGKTEFRRLLNATFVSHKIGKRSLLRAQERNNLSLNNSKYLTWTDESRFPIHTDGSIRIWRKQHVLIYCYCQMTLYVSSGGIMLHGMFYWSTLKYTYICKHILSQHLWQQWTAHLISIFWPIIFITLPYGDGHFQKDKVPCYCARSQIGLRNVNQKLTCFYGQISPLTHVLFRTCGTMSNDYFDIYFA